MLALQSMAAGGLSSAAFHLRHSGKLFFFFCVFSSTSCFGAKSVEVEYQRSVTDENRTLLLLIHPRRSGH